MNNEPSVDQYIQQFPEDVRSRLEKVRSEISKVIPEAKECMKYGIPTFEFNGNLVHYAGYKNHLGFYPGSSGIAHFSAEISNYKNAKGSIQFPNNQDLPIELILKITKFRIRENIEKAKLKKTIKTNKVAFDLLSAPARRALSNAGILTIQDLSKFKKSEILELHGIGKTSLPKLMTLLKESGLGFSTE